MLCLCSPKNIRMLDRIILSKHLMRTANRSLHGVANMRSCQQRCPPSHRVFTHQSLRLSPQADLRSFSDKTQMKKDQDPDFLELYLFEKIRHIRVLGRLAKYSCVSFVVGAPVCALSSFSDLMAMETSKTIISVLAFHMIVFTGQSLAFTSRILAKLMISNDEKTVKISHLSVFGNRKDIYVKTNDIVPFHDVGYEVFMKKMVTVKLKNSKRLFFMPEMGTIDTNFAALELILSGDLKEEENN